MLALTGQTVKLVHSCFYQMHKLSHVDMVLHTHSRKFAILMTLVVKPIQFALLTLIFSSQKSNRLQSPQKVCDESACSISLAFNFFVTIVVNDYEVLRLRARQDPLSQKDKFH